jgi:hypothetical protein
MWQQTCKLVKIDFLPVYNVTCLIMFVKMGVLFHKDNFT